MDLVTVPQEHLAAIALLSTFHERRCYVLEHGIYYDGQHYECWSPLVSSLAKHQLPSSCTERTANGGVIRLNCGEISGETLDLTLPLDKLLNPRQFNITALLADCKDSAEIGRVLGLTELVVRRYLHEIYQKLNVDGAYGRYTLAARYAQEWAEGKYPDLGCPIDIPQDVKLSSAENTTLEYITQSDADIAMIMGAKVRTVKAYVNRLKKKIGVHNRCGLAAYAILRKRVTHEQSQENRRTAFH
jgi:DNA-binding CsgD family transcriptional regulator